MEGYSLSFTLLFQKVVAFGQHIIDWVASLLRFTPPAQ